MFFTQEDIQKISKGLAELSIKDTQLPGTEEVLEQDCLAIVQDGKNKKVSVRDFLNNLGVLKKSDFINISALTDNTYNNIDEVVHEVPVNCRKPGLCVTFQDTDYNWKIYQFRGEANQWDVLTFWVDILDYSSYVVNGILPDEEDLTVSGKDEKDNLLLSLKDRKPSEDFVGKGYKILRRNIVKKQVTKTGILINKAATTTGTVGITISGITTMITLTTSDNTVEAVAKTIYDALIDNEKMSGFYITYESNTVFVENKFTLNPSISTVGKTSSGAEIYVNDEDIEVDKNILTQAAINQPNTIYEIRYDFDLYGAEIVIPEDCVLKFEGGSFKNGKISSEILNIKGNYKSSLHVELLGINITQNFIVTGEDSAVINTSKLSTSVGGLIIEGTIKVNEFYLKTNLIGTKNAKLLFPKYSRGILIDNTNNISITNIEISKEAPNTLNSPIRYRQNLYITDSFNIKIQNCMFNGSIDVVSTEDSIKLSSNVYITDNIIDCDFTNYITKNYEEADIITLRGVKNIYIERNQINFKNINRVFKCTAITFDYRSILKSNSHIYIKGNIIKGSSTQGKQFIDAFCGTTEIYLLNNNINIKGFSSLLENKSALIEEICNMYCINNNIDAEIKRLIYYNIGNSLSKLLLNGNNIVYNIEDDAINTQIFTRVLLSGNTIKSSKNFNMEIYTKAEEGITISDNDLSNVTLLFEPEVSLSKVYITNNIINSPIKIHPKAVIQSLLLFSNKTEQNYVINMMSEEISNIGKLYIKDNISNNGGIIFPANLAFLDKVCDTNIGIKYKMLYDLSRHIISSEDSRVLYHCKNNALLYGINFIYKGTASGKVFPIISPCYKSRQDLELEKVLGSTVYDTLYNQYLYWDGTQWLNPDGSSIDKVTIL